VLITFFLETLRTELALLSDCSLLSSESELISITCSGGGGLAGAFLGSLGAGLAAAAGAIVTFCCKTNDPVRITSQTENRAGRLEQKGVIECTLIAFFTS
jgi:hypothetical protein